MSDATLHQVCDTVAAVMKRPPEKIFRSTRIVGDRPFRDAPYRGINPIVVICALEEAFDVTIYDDELGRCRTCAGAAALIEEKLNARVH